MAEQYQIAGPVTIQYGGNTVGATDGQVRISVTMVEPGTEVTSDAAGGMPVDEIQHDSFALVRIVFSKRDRVIINNMRARLKAATTLAAEGEAQIPGLLRRADGVADRTLVLTGTKFTAANGMPQFTCLDAIADAQADIEESEIGGNEASRLAITMKAFSKLDSSVMKVYTTANISAA